MFNKLKHQIVVWFFDFAYGVVYRRREELTLLDKKESNRQFRLLKPTLRYWYADPMLASVNGKEYMFCEVFDRKTHKGNIGVAKFSKDGTLKQPQIILDEPFHLSFPLVFEYNDRFFMLPECSESRELRLYEMEEDVYHFRFVRTLLTNVKLVDTVIRESDGELLFLACEGKAENPKKTRLRLFGVKDLCQGELKEYPLNENDYSYALRNGGPILSAHGKEYRVIQESTEGEYGRNLKIARIEDLSKTGFSEEMIADIFLGDMPLSWPVTYRKQGTHTYGFDDNYEIADISFNRFHPGNLKYRG